MHLLTSWAAPRGVWDSDHSEGVANIVVKTNECQYPPEHLPRSVEDGHSIAGSSYRGADEASNIPKITQEANERRNI